jgi:hypothetical protein
LDNAVEIEAKLTGDPALKVRCLKAEYLVATAVTVGRLKDLARVQAFLEQGVVDKAALSGVLETTRLDGQVVELLRQGRD